jgi:hypothetical protein
LSDFLSWTVYQVGAGRFGKGGTMKRHAVQVVLALALAASTVSAGVNV